MIKIMNKLGLTAKDYNVSENEFWKIDYWITYSLKFDYKEDALDFHREKTEEDLFNWIHAGENHSPIEIKKSPLPSEMSNVCETKDGWFFWYP